MPGRRLLLYLWQRMDWRGWAVLLALVALFLYLFGDYAPETGRFRILLLPRWLEIALGQSSAAAMAMQLQVLCSLLLLLLLLLLPPPPLLTVRPACDRCIAAAGSRGSLSCSPYYGATRG
jgi:hypothetical protein